MSAERDDLVSLRGVTRWFGKEQVLGGVDLSLPRGTVTAILGRNGSGKTTLMRILCGTLARHGGQAEVLGRDPELLRPQDLDRLAVVNDALNAWPETKVADELSLVKGLRGARWDNARAEELLERFEVPRDKRLRQLSKGQQARLRLVLALGADPELLLLDEPALGLDLFARHDLLEAIIETVEREGRAVLIASHLIDDVERVADRVVFLRQGRITVGGTIDELRDQFRRVRVELAPDDGEGARLDEAAEALLGIKRIRRERDDPAQERVVVCEDYTAPLVAELADRCGAAVLETRRMTLREIYFEVLAGRAEEARSEEVVG